MLPLPLSVAAEYDASTPEGPVPSVGVQLVAVPARTTTMRRPPLPLVQVTVIWLVATDEKDRSVASEVGSDATIVCVPPALADPVLLPAAKSTLLVASAFTERVFPGVAPAATSAVRKKYPVSPVRIGCENAAAANVCGPAAPGLAFVASVASPASKAPSAE